jgi:hypothetical protein
MSNPRKQSTKLKEERNKRIRITRFGLVAISNAKSTIVGSHWNAVHWNSATLPPSVVEKRLVLSCSPLADISWNVLLPFPPDRGSTITEEDVPERQVRHEREPPN